MSRSDRRQREAERAARRAERLAQRAEQRAVRKEEQARAAMERAERLAERADRRPSRERDLERSIEDLVDEVTEKWTRKAEAWIDEQTDRMFVDEPDAMADVKDSSREADQARADAKKAREQARAAREQAKTNSSRRRSRRGRSNPYSMGSQDNWGFSTKSWKWNKKRDRGNLYRDKQNGKVCGVCAGIADYFDVATWQIRLYAVIGLFIIPSVIVPAYFIAYFMLDDMPYYRRVTDRFDEFEDLEEEEIVSESKKQRFRGKRNQSDASVTQISNRDALRTAKERFGNIEHRLRAMETHVTSSRFELQRELRKISGEDS